ncbi:hypothetical protein HK102_005979, partial [Quaeritorhiza haematococci]
LGASKDLIESVFRLHAPREKSEQERAELIATAEAARASLVSYFHELKQNTMRGNRANSGLDELGLSFLMDDGLAQVLRDLRPTEPPAEPVLHGTTYYVTQHPEMLPQLEPATDLASRIERLKHIVMLLPKELHEDFFEILSMSKTQYQASRVIVWTSALMVLGMLCGLMALFHRWVLNPINNPLASIAFCSEALENRLGALAGSADDPDHRVIGNYLKMIQEEAFRCKSITEKLLDFARCGDIKRERADLPSLIQGVVDMIRHIGKYRGKTIQFQPKEAVLAHVDGQEIKQVVLNLAVNALESMDAGGVLRIDCRYDRGMAEIVLADDGCGMSPDVLENIFEPFFTRRRDGKGTGLGLSITHRIINQHHGEITASSPGIGRGSTFRVRLPIHPSEKAEAATRELAAPVHAA